MAATRNIDRRSFLAEAAALSVVATAGGSRRAAETPGRVARARAIREAAAREQARRILPSPRTNGD